MMRILSGLFSCLFVLALSVDGLAQAPSGTVTFSGPGLELLASDLFVPDAFEDGDNAWSFFETANSDTLAVLIAESDGDPTTAAAVIVADQGGATWSAIGFFGPVAGVSISEDTVTFSNATLPQMGVSSPKSLTLDGSLTRPTVVEADAGSLGALKRGFAGRD